MHACIYNHSDGGEYCDRKMCTSHFSMHEHDMGTLKVSMLAWRGMLQQSLAHFTFSEKYDQCMHMACELCMRPCMPWLPISWKGILLRPHVHFKYLRNYD